MFKTAQIVKVKLGFAFGKPYTTGRMNVLNLYFG